MDARKHPLPLSLWERCKFGMIWGLNLAQQDFEKYLLYFMLTRCGDPACGYLELYSEWLLVASIIAFPVNIVSGWLTDFTSERQHRVQQGSLLLQTVCLAGMYVLATTGHGRWAQVLYQVRQACIVQSMTSVWKILKIRLDVVTQQAYLRDPAGGDERLKDVENVVVSFVGVFGDISAEVIEMAALGACLLLRARLGVAAMSVAMALMSLAMNVVPIVLAFTVTTRDLTLPMSEIAFDALRHGADPAATERDALLRAQATAQRRRARLYARPCGTRAAQRVRRGARWLWRRLRYMCTTPTVINTALHSLTVLLMYNILTYPITLLVQTETSSDASLLPPPALSSSTSTSTSTSADDGTASFCHGTLINLVEQGVVLQLCYFVFSLLYMLFLVQCPPRIYYIFVQPFLVVVTAASLVAILLWRARMPHLLLTVIVSVAQIVPFYINTFTYYVFNTAVRQDYYGVVLAVYAFGSQTMQVIVSYILYSSVAVQLLVFICGGLLIVIVIHGVAMNKLFYNPNWADQASSSDDDDDDEDDEDEEGDGGNAGDGSAAGDDDGTSQ